MPRAPLCEPPPCHARRAARLFRSKGLILAGHARRTMLTLSSPAFEQGGRIPSRYTCEGKDVSPPLAWSDGPPGTKAFALIADDPDAPDPKHPKTRWAHWLLFDLPASMRGLTEAVQRLPEGAEQGLNDSRDLGYGG